MDYFLQDVAHYLYRKNEGDFRNTLLVFPNRRARLFFNHFLSEFTNRPIWAPRFLTINEFVQQLSGLQVADPLTLTFKLYQVFKEVTQSGESFDSFYFYCEMILADFDDIDKYHVQADKLFSNLKDLKDLEDLSGFLDEEQLQMLRNFWEVVNQANDSREKKDFISLWNALHKIYIRFNEVLDVESISYEGKAYREGLDLLNSSNRADVLSQQLVFVGFNALNYSEELLFDRFKKQGNALFFWDYTNSYIDNPKHEAGFFLRKYTKRYPQPADFTATPYPPPADQTIHTLAVPASLTQAKVIEHSMKLIGAEEINSPLETALILADENLLLPVVNSLPASTDKINISMGYPLVDTPLYSLISAITDMQARRRNKAGSKNAFIYYHRDFFNVFQHELLREVTELEAFSEYLTLCRLKNSIYIDPEEIPTQHPLLEAILSPVEAPKFLGRYLRIITEKLAQRLLQSGDSSNKAQWDAELLHGVHKVLMRYEALLEETDISMNFNTVLNLFRKILQGISVPFLGEPLEGLQVMGILETRTLDFENLVILSMNEGKFPKGGSAPSLIPYSLREGFGLPTQKHQDAIFGYYFYRLLHRAKNIVLVYNTKTEGLQKGEPSRYVQQIRFDEHTSILHHNLGYRIEQLASKEIQVIKDAKTMSRQGCYLRPEGTKFLSPSALSCYLQCKLKFYFRYVQEMHEPDQVEEDVEANVFGSILHKAMALLYEDHINRPLSEAALVTLLKNKKQIVQAVDRAFAEEYFHQEADAELNYKGRDLIIRKVIIRYIEGIITYDSKNAPFTILSLEKMHSCIIPLEGSNRKVSLGGFIDRLDNKNGSLRVIDYKTGRKKNTASGIDQLYTLDGTFKSDALFQSFMYCWILDQQGEERNLIPQLFFLRNIENSSFDPGIKINRQLVSSYAGYAPEFNQGLKRMLNELFDSNTPFTQTTDTKQCKYCPYLPVCMRKTE